MFSEFLGLEENELTEAIANIMGNGFAEAIAPYIANFLYIIGIFICVFFVTAGIYMLNKKSTQKGIQYIQKGVICACIAEIMTAGMNNKSVPLVIHNSTFLIVIGISMICSLAYCSKKHRHKSKVN